VVQNQFKPVQNWFLKFCLAENQNWTNMSGAQKKPELNQNHGSIQVVLVLCAGSELNFGIPTPYTQLWCTICHPLYIITCGWGPALCVAYCHGPCSVTFFPKNNHQTAMTESPMMAPSPLFSATLTTSHPRWTYIGPPSEFFLYSNTTKKSSFLSLPLPTSTMHYLPQHNQSPTMLHTRSML